VKGGKLLFGRKKLGFEAPVPWRIHQPADSPEPLFELEGETTPWTEMFSNKKDRLILHCPEAQIDTEFLKNVHLHISEEGVAVFEAGTNTSAKQKIPLEKIQAMQGQCEAVVIPREAMGLGDVKFMALIGAFLGWQGVLFTLFAASIIGSVISVLFILCRKREWAQKVPFGPYLALGSAIFLFYGKPILAWYLTPKEPGLTQIYGFWQAAEQFICLGRKCQISQILGP
jgi:leader peptidase (prepilin peptidase)/N-methyltransferase